MMYLKSILTVLFAIITGCGGGSGGSDGPTLFKEMRFDVHSAGAVLYYLPGDSMAMLVTVRVYWRDGYQDVEPVAGERVVMAISDTTLGTLEFCDTLLRDITDENGYVRTVFTSFGIQGIEHISATYNGGTIGSDLIIRELSSATISVTYQTDCDSLISLPDRPDSCEICATLRERELNNQTVVGVSLNMSATGGRYSIPPLTDVFGRSCFNMYLDEGSFGYFCVVVYSDSLCFNLPG